MSNQAEPEEIELFTAENEFDFQISLERAFAQLAGDESNASLLKYLEVMTLRSQNQSIEDIADQLNKGYDETKAYLSECRQRLMQYPPIQWCWEEYSEQNEAVLLKWIARKSDQEEQNWINLLAGQPVPEADPNTVRETQLFRAALLSYADKLKYADEVPYPHILENVLAQLAVVEPPPTPLQRGLSKLKEGLSRLQQGLKGIVWVKPNKYKWYYQPVPISALVVSLLVAIIFYRPQIIEPNEPTTQGIAGARSNDVRSKGVKRCLNRKYVSQPQTVATQIKTELEALGIPQVTLEQKDEKKWRLKATLPAERSSALEEFIKRENPDFPPDDPDYLCFTFKSKEAE